MTCNRIRTRRFFPFIKCPSTGNALSRLSRLKVGCVYLINSRQNSFGRIINCIILSRQVYILRRIISPFVYNLIVCNRLRLECPSTFVGDGSNYFISAIIGCAFIFCPTAKGVCTIGGFVLIAIYIGCIHRVFGFDFGVIGGVVCRKGNTFGSIAAPIVVDCVNLLFRCPLCN